MRIEIDQRSVQLTVDFDVRWQVVLEPGAWVALNRGQAVSITSLYGKLVEDQFHIAYPKGVTSKAGGGWSAQERILADVLPLDPAAAWKAIPPAIRDALEDAYLLSRDDLPEQLERRP